MNYVVIVVMWIMAPVWLGFMLKDTDRNHVALNWLGATICFALISIITHILLLKPF